ncbi:acyl carrier protein [Halodesulfovibrio sp.]|uniref:acyl carrier protein n=1 Tax=Halodesulfovibrio sp. TaxID=1912772 RepID=UPI0025BFDCDE|nr:acyl carrier protein [Halodesulfovibrio sp.]
MSTFTQVQHVITEVLEVEPEEVTPSTYVLRDLPTESIDLMEYGIGLNKECGISVSDDIVFLKSLRLHMAEAEDNGIEQQIHLRSVYPHLSTDRIQEILQTVNAGPVLQVQDIVAYIEHAKRA